MRIGRMLGTTIITLFCTLTFDQSTVLLTSMMWFAKAQRILACRRVTMYTVLYRTVLYCTVLHSRGSLHFERTNILLWGTVEFLDYGRSIDKSSAR